jgi:hypothetical protein
LRDSLTLLANTAGRTRRSPLDQARHPFRDHDPSILLQTGCSLRRPAPRGVKGG